jgi:glycosyltransferase involved in cell wall biosynthesis
MTKTVSGKKILILTHEFAPFYGGIGTYCAEMAMAAHRLGHNVTLMCPRYEEDHTELDASFPFAIKRFPNRSSIAGQMWQVSWELLRIKPDAYDIVQSADFPFTVAYDILYPLKKFPFSVMLHGTDAIGFAQGRVTRFLHATKTLRHATWITANSDYTKSLAYTNHPYLDPDSVKTALLGVNAEWFEDGGDADAVCEKYNIPKDRKILITVARLDKRKGHINMLKALTHLPQSYKDQLVYVISGRSESEEHYAELQKLAASCGVPVLFLGRVPTKDIKSLYKASWLYCMTGQLHPRKVEGFGLVYLEAAAQGVPSLATAIGGVPEVVLHDKTGYLVEGSDDPSPDIAQALTYLLDHPDRVEAYGCEALQWAKTFTWDRCAEETYS